MSKHSMSEIKVFLATPAYDGRVHVQYATSFADTVLVLAKHGIDVMPRIHTSGSLLVAERNKLVEAFWESDCTHLLFVDSDLGWPGIAVKALLDHNKDFVAGVYPSRREKSFLFRPCLNPDTSVVIENGLVKMEYIPAGFMLLKREAIKKMRDFFPELYFKPKHKESVAPPGYLLFNTEVWEGEFWGEDYVFCRRARQAGIDIWVDPMIEFDHAGQRGMLVEAFTQDKDKSMKGLEHF